MTSLPRPRASEAESSVQFFVSVVVDARPVRPFVVAAEVVHAWLVVVDISVPVAGGVAHAVISDGNVVHDPVAAIIAYTEDYGFFLPAHAGAAVSFAGNAD